MPKTKMHFKQICIKVPGLCFLRKWFLGEDASVAMEFSMLAVPYFMLVLATIEISLMFASASLLEGATGSAARLIRTGQIQQAAADPAAAEQMFRDGLCAYATVLIDCNQIVTESILLTSFDEVSTSEIQRDEDGNVVSGGFDAGGANNRLLVRTAYEYTMLTPFVGPLLGGPNNAILFVSTIVLQAEPYDLSFDDV